jgi:serine/threonine protein kinase
MENILISSVEDKTEYEIRVADFGLAVFTPDDEPLTGKCGSPGFVAPEVFRGPNYSYKADVFSLGACFYQLLVGDYLFDGKTAKSIMRRNIECDLTH